MLAEETIDRLALFADPVAVALPQIQPDASIRVELAMTVAGATPRRGQQLPAETRRMVLQVAGVEVAVGQHQTARPRLRDHFLGDRFLRNVHRRHFPR